MKLSEIGKTISISPKTIRRRLDRMQNSHILEFTILPNPHAMKGQIMFFLEVKVESSRLYRAVVEKIFHELHNHLILYSILYDQVERIGLILASEDVFKIESIRSRIESLNGVKEANIFLLTKIEYNQDSIVKSIEGKFTKIEKPYKNTIMK